MHVSTSLWRGWMLCAIAGFMLLLTGTASAETNFNVATRSTFTVDSDVHWMQQDASNHEKVLTYGAYQYISYWDAADREGNVYLKVTRRKLADNTTESTIFNTAEGRQPDPLDYHNTSAMGVSPIDGRLHVEGVLHNRPMRYAISSSGCLTQARFSSCTFTWQAQTSNRAQEEAVTYPQYFNDRAGNLYCAFRSGSGTTGEYVLHKYNNNGTWTDKGTILSGLTGTGEYDVDGAGGWSAARTRGPYVDAIAFDKADRLHMTWTWRENVPAREGVGIHPFLAQHDIYYSYSDDFGTTWKDNGGTTVGTVRTEPITIADTSTVAVELPYGYWRINSVRMTLDRDNQPHIMMESSDEFTTDPRLARLRTAHFWRQTNGVWGGAFVEPVELARDAGGDIAVGDMMFSHANDAYYLLAKDQIDWRPYNNESCPTCGYNLDLPGDHFTIQEENYLNIKPATREVIMDTMNRVGKPIERRSATDNRDIVIRMKNTLDASDGRFYFTTDASPIWAIERHVDFTDRNDGEWHTYTISLERTTGWTGTLRELELYPAQSTTGTRGEVLIDYIRLENDSGTIAKEWEFTKAFKMYSAESSGSDNWRTWQINEIMPGVNMEWYDASSFGIDDRRYESDGTIDFPVVTQGAPLSESETLQEFRFLEDGYTKVWGFGADEIGWSAHSNVTGFGYASDGGWGTIAGTISAAGSSVESANNLNLPLGTASRIRVRMKNSTATGQRGSICWAVNGQRTYTESRCSSKFAITADGAYHLYEISTAGWREWERQELTRLRFDPSDNEEISRGTFNIDYVHIVN